MTYMEPQGGITLNNLLISLTIIGWSLKKNPGDIPDNLHFKMDIISTSNW